MQTAFAWESKHIMGRGLTARNSRPSILPMAATEPAGTFRKTTETFRAGAETLPQRYFVSPEIFAVEQTKIFSREWVCVGHESELARPGDYLVKVVAGESLIIVRDRNDKLHAFYNVCRHRGTRLCEEERGHAGAIQCPYHAWTYGLDGDGKPMLTSSDGATRIVLYGLKLGAAGVFPVEAGIRSNVYRNLGGECRQSNLGGSDGLRLNR